MQNLEYLSFLFMASSWLSGTVNPTRTPRFSNWRKRYAKREPGFFSHYCVSAKNLIGFFGPRLDLEVVKRTCPKTPWYKKNPGSRFVSDFFFSNNDKNIKPS